VRSARRRSLEIGGSNDVLCFRETRSVNTGVRSARQRETGDDDIIEIIKPVPPVKPQQRRQLTEGNTVYACRSQDLWKKGVIVEVLPVPGKTEEVRWVDG